ncbi:MAG: hypothetical protein AB1758_22390 [Candidatus Eremiobacterota bacterium]
MTVSSYHAGPVRNVVTAEGTATGGQTDQLAPGQDYPAAILAAPKKVREAARPEPFHVSMQIAGSLLPSLAGYTLALVKESEVKNGQWVGHTVVALPEIRHADVDPSGDPQQLVPLQLPEWRGTLVRDPAILHHLNSHPDQPSYLTSQGTITTGQTLGEAARACPGTPEVATLNLAVAVPGELVSGRDHVTLAFIPTAELAGNEWDREPGSVAVAGRNMVANPVAEPGELYAPMSNDLDKTMWKVLPRARRNEFNEQVVSKVLSQKGVDVTGRLAELGLDAPALVSAMDEFPPFDPTPLTAEQVADPEVRKKVAAGELVWCRYNLIEFQERLGAERDLTKDLESARAALTDLKGQELEDSWELVEHTSPEGAMAYRYWCAERSALAALSGTQGDDTCIGTIELMARKTCPPGSRVDDPTRTMDFRKDAGGSVAAALQRFEDGASRLRRMKWGHLAAGVATFAAGIGLGLSGHIGGSILAIACAPTIAGVAFVASMHEPVAKAAADFWRTTAEAAREGDLALARHVQKFFHKSETE